MQPIISILHPTVRPVIWRDAADLWFQYCSRKEDVEYVTVTEKKYFPDLRYAQSAFVNSVARYNEEAATTVGGYNYAARIATGKIFVTVADDFYPCQNWDVAILDLLQGKLDKEVVVWVGTQKPDFDSGFISLPILTRAYYERSKYIFWPEYSSYYADVDFTEMAKLYGAEIIDARETIQFNHKQGGRHGDFRHDEHYLKHGGPAGVADGILFGKRQGQGFPR